MKNYKLTISMNTIEAIVFRVISVTLIIIALVGLNISANVITYSNSIDRIVFHLLLFISCFSILLQAGHDFVSGCWPFERVIKRK